jgi:CMP-N,N'-diacetyllegionaminic acid synthase
MGSNVLCTICARGGSQGVKNKNIRLLLGKPLIAHTIEQAKTSGLFDQIVISTDSDAIADIAIQHGAEVFFKRPSELASNTAPKLPAIRHALLQSEEHFNKMFDYLVDLDPTSPLRSSDDIVAAYHQFTEHENDNLFSAMPASSSPYFNMVELSKEGKVIISKKPSSPIYRRQDAPKVYDMNASIYVWKRDVLLNQDSIFLEKTGLYIMPEERSIDIDTEMEFDFVEFIMTKRQEND